MPYSKRLLIFGSLLLLLAPTAYTSYSQGQRIAPTNHSENAILIGRAVLPATTFADGPISGTQIGKISINGVSLPFFYQSTTCTRFFGRVSEP